MISTTTNLILNHKQIQYKIKRITYQIYESNVREQEIIIAGIGTNGYEIAIRMAKFLQNISPIKVVLCQVIINPNNPLEVTTSLDIEIYQNKPLILVDDVLNSGKTLIYGIRHFLSVPLKRFKSAVLVNRNHKQYPVKADFKGISLSTSLNEHVRVVLSDTEDAVFLE